MAHNQDIDSFYQEMASQAAEVTEDLNGKLLFCAEVSDGVVSSAVVFEKGGDKIPSFVFTPSSLVDKVYEFWTRWTLEFNNEWRIIELSLQNGEFEINLIYPDQIDADLHFDDFRDEIFERHFGGKPIDYSASEF